MRRWSGLTSCSPPQTGSPPAVHSAAARVPPALCEQTQTKSQRQEAGLQAWACARARARLSLLAPRLVSWIQREDAEAKDGAIHTIQEFWETLLIGPEK